MIIHSSFHDYYDKMMAFGRDPKIHYIRKTEELWVYDRSFSDSFQLESVINNKIEKPNFYPELVGFCGEIIPLFNIVYSDNDNQKYLYDIESIKKIMGEADIPNIVTEWINNVRFFGHWATPSNYITRFINLFEKYKTPIFYVNRKCNGINITINPRLNKIEFFRKYSAFEAWQKLSHYVGNVMIEESKPIWPVPDKIKAESHGFDKHSFRKDKKTLS